ncbi:MAG: Ig-like domain-containing protein, partial [Pirellulaceae bacterium]
VADGSQLNFETTTSYTLTVEVPDSGAPSMTDTATITINVNDLNETPTVNDDTFAVDENETNGTLVGTVTASDPDAGDSLSYVITAGDPTGIFTIDASGNITVADGSQLNFEATTSYTLSVEVTDAGAPGLTDTATITINVNDLNETPTVSDDTFAVDENETNGTLVGSVTASDPDAGDSLSYAITAGDPTGIFAIDASGNISVADGSQLNFEATTSYTLSVEVTDAGAPGLTDTATITINVNDVNETPTVNNQLFNIDENSGIATPAGTILASDPDAGDLVSFNVIGGSGVTAFNVHPTTGLITVLDPLQLDHEVNPFMTLVVEVTDSGGLTDTATIRIDINDINDAPVLTNNGALLNEGDTEIIDNSELDATDQDNLPVELSFTVTSGPVNGFLALSSAPLTPITSFTQADIDAGRLIYVHNGGETTSDFFLFDLGDGSGSTITGQRFDLTVNPVNDAPVANADSFAVNEDTTLAASSILANDTDVDSGLLTAVLVAGPSNSSSFTLNADGTFSYSPEANFFGADSFQYRAHDGALGSNIVTVTIAVAPVNDLPVAVGDSFTAVVSDTLVELAGVLINDADVENDALVAILVTGPSNGTLTLNPDGTFSYVPASGFVGSDSFTYMANDGSGNSPVTVVEIEVVGPGVDDTGTDPDPETESTDPPEEDPGDDEDPTEDPEQSNPATDPSANSPITDVTGANDLAGSAEDFDIEALNSILAGKAGSMFAPDQQQAMDVLEWMLAERMEKTEQSIDRSGVTFGGFTFAFDAQYLWQQLDQLADDVGKKGLFEFGFTSSVAVTTITATAGYVIWSLRGGFLMATLVSSLPAWSHIDPLPVLETGGKRSSRVVHDGADQLFDQGLSR